MPELLQFLYLLLAYLMGSIPTAVWVGQWFYGIDIREFGSGNAGATNTFRVLGKKAGIPVLLFDILKGFLAVQLTPYAIAEIPGSNSYVNFQIVLGICALIGHIFPVFVGFRGGKGIATLLGIILAMHTPAALLSIGVFLFVFLLTRYVSLGSITAALAFPLIITLAYEPKSSSLVVFGIFISIMVLITHQRNIERLLRRSESRVNLRWAKNPKEHAASEEFEEDED
jgi:glycerol-3-phosphate acyltransferase PlsY